MYTLGSHSAVHMAAGGLAEPCGCLQRLRPELRVRHCVVVRWRRGGGRASHACGRAGGGRWCLCVSLFVSLSVSVCPCVCVCECFGSVFWFRVCVLVGSCPKHRQEPKHRHETGLVLCRVGLSVTSCKIIYYLSSWRLSVSICIHTHTHTHTHTHEWCICAFLYTSPY